jgi:DNA-directed RNA polymerase subunit E'
LFYICTVTDVIRIPPSNAFGSLNQIARTILNEKYIGKVDRELGVIIAILSVKVSPIGKIIQGDGATYHKVKFKVLTFSPIIQEVVEAEIVEVVDFGVFVRLGPLDGLIHISQIADDHFSFDSKQKVLHGKNTGRSVAVGDRVRARIVSVGLSESGPRATKIGLTMRQPFFGKLEWIEEDLLNIRKAAFEAKKKINIPK